MTKSGILKMALVAGVLSLPSPAFAHHGIPIYRYTFYSDASLTTQVGEDVGYCAFFGPAYSHTGQSTDYYTSYQIMYCANDGHGWYEEPI